MFDHFKWACTTPPVLASFIATGILAAVVFGDGGYLNPRNLWELFEYHVLS